MACPNAFYFEEKKIGEKSGLVYKKLVTMHAQTFLPNILASEAKE